MSDTQSPTPSAELARIVESAKRLGVEVHESEALEWLTAMAASQATGGDVVVDVQDSVYGYKVSMLDFSPAQLAHFRAIGKIAGVPDQPGVVETALALSGSAAQSKIQSYPGDCDYFQRVNIKAPTKEEACGILAKLMRGKVLDTYKGPNYQFLEVKYGSYKFDCMKNGKPKKKGSPVSWSYEQVREGKIDVFRMDGTPDVIRWEDFLMEPGWCKFDWVVADRERGQLANASNVLDVTWEAPDGSITPLDGYLDAYFQEVYLDAGSIPVFSKLVKHLSPDALDDYVEAIRGEVRKYLTEHLNYAKAAKRMYNVFRMTGRYEEAAFIRELFDEPTTVLYQVWSLLGTIDNAVQPDSSIPIEEVIQQADALILEAVNALEGDQENEVVKSIIHLRESLAARDFGESWSIEVNAAQTQVVNVINNFFRDKLVAVPTIKEYIDSVQQEAQAGSGAEQK